MADRVTCQACGAAFESQEDLDKHGAQAHARTTRCPECGMEFASDIELNDHAKSEHVRA